MIGIYLGMSPVKIGLLMDESTDLSNCSQLMRLVRYVKETGVCKHVHCSCPLKMIKVLYLISGGYLLSSWRHLPKCAMIGLQSCSKIAQDFAAFIDILGTKIAHCVLHRHTRAEHIPAGRVSMYKGCEYQSGSCF